MSNLRESSHDIAFHEDETGCQYVFSKGERKEEYCGQSTIQETHLCGFHWRKVNPPVKYLDWMGIDKNTRVMNLNNTPYLVTEMVVEHETEDDEHIIYLSGVVGDNGRTRPANTAELDFARAVGLTVPTYF